MCRYLFLALVYLEGEGFVVRRMRGGRAYGVLHDAQIGVADTGVSPETMSVHIVWSGFRRLTDGSSIRQARARACRVSQSW